MKMYCCIPTVTETTKKWSLVHQVPMFYLNPRVQGIVSVKHAEGIVTGICNPSHNKNIVVSPNVTEVEVSE